MKIFISIAAYRDPELIPTIKDFISNESGQHTIIYGICLQDTPENYNIVNDTFRDIKHIKIYFMNYKLSKGVCYARKILQNMVQDEDYFLQMDSHMRSVKNWDTILINNIILTKCNKPILSSYPPDYKINDTAKSYLLHSSYMNITKLNLPIHKNTTMHGCRGDYLNTTGIPIRNIHIAAGFYFVPVKWIKEVPYPEDIYFEGEEDYLTVLSYTKGWTVFCPDQVIVFHCYTNNLKQSKEKYRPLHWEDHNINKMKFNTFNIKSLQLGNKRTLSNYFIELNQFTDNYQEIEIPISLSLNINYQFTLYDKENKLIYKNIHKRNNKSNTIKINIKQIDLHKAYYYIISEVYNSHYIADSSNNNPINYLKYFFVL